LVEYLPLYNEFQKQRHQVRPGLTGLAQVNGRNAISWEDKFGLDIEYISNLKFTIDLKIFILSIKKVLIREGITSENSSTVEKFTGSKN
jgi:lipopolysaccharide/colanic/teichoic acid biosynthesis glycosyltransferase